MKHIHFLILSFIILSFACGNEKPNDAHLAKETLVKRSIAPTAATRNDETKTTSPVKESRGAGLTMSISDGDWRNREHAGEVAVQEARKGFRSFVDFDSTRAKIQPEHVDCYEKECLIAVGLATGANYGLRVKWYWTPQGYPSYLNWEVDVYDLKNGVALAIEKATCGSNCGEVQAFAGWRKILQKALESVPSAQGN